MLKQHVVAVSTLGLLAIVSVSQCRLTSASQAAPPLATAEVQRLVKQALEDRLAANNLPDGNLLWHLARIPVREEMPRTGTRLGDGALPQRAGRTFYLLPQAAAQREAEETSQSVFFVTADQPSITEDTATLWIGVDVVTPREPKRVVLCCCRGLGQFRRVENHWEFEKWIQMICS